MREFKEREIKRANTLYAVEAVGIELDSMQTVVRQFTAKKNNPDFIEKRFNELFLNSNDNVKFVKATAVEQESGEYRSATESQVRAVAIPYNDKLSAEQKAVKITLYETEITALCFDYRDECYTNGIAELDTPAQPLEYHYDSNTGYVLPADNDKDRARLDEYLCHLGGSMVLKHFIIPRRLIDDKLTDRQNIANIIHYLNHSYKTILPVCAIVQADDKSQQYCMSNAQWLNISSPCEPPKKRDKQD